MELLESDSMPWSARTAVELRTFGEMLKSETVEMLERLKRWNPLDWNGFRIKSGRCLTYGSCASVNEVHEWDMLISMLNCWSDQL